MRRTCIAPAITVSTLLLAAGCSRTSGTAGGGLGGTIEAEQQATLSDTQATDLILSAPTQMAKLQFPVGAAPGGTVVNGKLVSGVIKQGGTPVSNRVVQLLPRSLILSQPATLTMNNIAPPASGKVLKMLFAREEDTSWTILPLMAPPASDVMNPPDTIQASIDRPGVWGIVEADATGGDTDGGTSMDGSPGVDGGGGGRDSSTGGPGWMALSSASTAQLTSVWASSGADGLVIATGEAGRVLRSMDNGVTWGAVDTGTANGLTGVWGSGPTDIYVTSGSIQAFHSTDAGMTWGRLTLMVSPLNPFHGVGGSSATDVFMVGLQGEILHQTDVVKGFVSQTSGTTNALNAIVSNGSNALAAGDMGTLLGTANGGAMWAAFASVTTANLYGAWGTFTGAWAVGDMGTILTVNATSATPVPSGTANALRAITGLGTDSPTDIYVVGDLGTILHSTDRGATFNAETSNTTANLRGVWATSAAVYAVGDGGTIVKRTAGSPP